MTHASQMADLYRAGFAVSEIGRLYDRHVGTVRHHLKKQGVRSTYQFPSGITRDRKSRFSLDLSAFSSPLSDSACYWLGLLMADGCLFRKTGNSDRLYLTLHSRDVAHVQRFLRFLGSNAPIETHHDGTVRCSIISNELGAVVERFGITPRKSLTAAPNPRISMNRHFWRGVVDGDGCIRIRADGQPSFYIVGSRAMMEHLHRFYLTVCPESRCQPKQATPTGVWRFVVSGNMARKIVRELYRDTLLALPRKAKIAEAICSTIKQY